MKIYFLRILQRIFAKPLLTRVYLLIFFVKPLNLSTAFFLSFSATWVYVSETTFRVASPRFFLFGWFSYVHRFLAALWRRSDAVCERLALYIHFSSFVRGVIPPGLISEVLRYAPHLSWMRTFPPQHLPFSILFRWSIVRVFPLDLLRCRASRASQQRMTMLFR